MALAGVRRGAAATAACGTVVALLAGCGTSTSHGTQPVGQTGAGVSPGTTTGSAKGEGMPASGAPTSQSPATADAKGTPALPGGVVPVYPAWPTPIPPYTKSVDKWTAPMKAADAAGLKVWIETDLVKAWKAGPDKFAATVGQLGVEAQADPGVVGFKIADELGQNPQSSTTSPEEALRFLHDARAALHAAAPGKLILIDVIGYDLGCVPGSTADGRAKCLSDNAANDARLDLGTIDQIVGSGYVDALDVTTNMLRPEQYQKNFKVTRAQAQQAAFAEIQRRGWDKKVIVNTRKALSWNTDTIPDAATAAALVPDFIDVPVAAGAKAVDTWSFSQLYSKTGKPVYQLSPGYQTNPLWDALKAEKARGVQLFTHYTPSYSLGTLGQDIAGISQAFTGVFCAAGTG
ncbi:MAG: hypothetical protein HOW97_11450 [Catenulispora sp.]|nr:hypothetical protein [Catenulispora sp.]